ncbi:Rne/Rng family ribonuclease [Nocardioides sp. STR2]|uniref:Rne/Rng family ribonuclease n=1 Tax=Nocardioides pini TaxID=2975053 RepID=A0ABT4CIK7_9ACTN|nr:Rne/Rng family ribonuclease [Nocardioides pini]MCY4727814.1 Rne/Rng family ribonuclease [Nocardioides pini]
MLSDDQNDQPERTESGTPTPEAASPPTEGAAPAAPVVTRRTRKAPAKKAAAVPPAGDAPAEATTDASPDAASAAGEADAPVVRKTASRRAPAKKAPARKSAAKKAATTPEPDTAVETDAAPAAEPVDEAPAPARKTSARKSAAKAPAKKTAAKRAAKKTAATPEATAPEADADAPAAETAAEAPAADAPTGPAVLFQAPVVTTTTRRTRTKAAPAPVETAPVDDEAAEAVEAVDEAPAPAKKATARKSAAKKSADRPARKKAAKKTAAAEPAPDLDEDDEDAAAALAGAQADDTSADVAEGADTGGSADSGDFTESGESADDTDGDGGSGRRRRRRGGRRRRKSGEGNGEGSGEGDAPDAGSTDAADDSTDSAAATSAEGDSDATDGNGEGSSRRRRRRRRAGEEGSSDDGDANTVTRVRKGRSAEDQITSVQGSTRLEAKKQRRREGREAGRRRAPIVSEAEFLARRESVERVMVIRQRRDLTQIAVLEDKVLVEHYVARESQTSLIGNVYLGRVQNVLPSMEAAFIDIGKGRNAVLYAGEVNWQSLGHKEGQPRKIESVLSSGQMVLVQVTKDPVGHKGARLTSQVSLAGRFLVYVPDGTTSGISRKLPDTERSRLKTLLKEIVPDTAGVIVRTAAEGASEEELTRDVERLKARWEDIEKKATHKGSGPQLLYGEPDLTLKVVRDLFTEDFAKLVIEGDEAWDTVHGYVESVAPDLAERLERFERGATGGDVFSTYRIDEQIHKGLDRKVWLPSGGSLIIDRTEAMTVVDVNTGKFTGSGGNLEETVTKNNLEAAEEIVRQLRLRDIGGIIVVDFIDMVLESNRDLVVRRLVECLGRDRTRHQVAEVTSLGLVQMTRKRIGTGLLEAFSENCEHCHGRGVVIKDQPVDPDARPDEGEGRRSSRRRGRRGGNDDAGNGAGNGGGNADAKATEAHHAPSPKDVAAMARHERQVEESRADEASASDTSADAPAVEDAQAVATQDDVPRDDVPQGEAAQDEAPQDEAPQAETPQAEAPQGEVAPDEAPQDDAPQVEAVAPVDTSREQAHEALPAEPEKPKVVTRTRRRSASRPAGPPSGVGTVLQTGAVEPGTAGIEPGSAAPFGGPAAPVSVDGVEARADARADTASGGSGETPVVEHVPIKKKGSRKR